MTYYTTLREANIARQAEWDAGNAITLTYRANELAGEMGEACNVIKKLERERLGIRGSRATLLQLAEELADVVICADLTAMTACEDMEMNTGFPVGLSRETAPLYLVHKVGRLCYLIESSLPVTGGCLAVERAARAVANFYGIDLDAAVVAKFNATSEKVSLATRLAA